MSNCEYTRIESAPQDHAAIKSSGAIILPIAKNEELRVSRDHYAGNSAINIRHYTYFHGPKNPPNARKGMVSIPINKIDAIFRAVGELLGVGIDPPELHPPRSRKKRRPVSIDSS